MSMNSREHSYGPKSKVPQGIVDTFDYMYTCKICGLEKLHSIYGTFAYTRNGQSYGINMPLCNEEALNKPKS